MQNKPYKVVKKQNNIEPKLKLHKKHQKQLKPKYLPIMTKKDFEKAEKNPSKLTLSEWLKQEELLFTFKEPKPVLKPQKKKRRRILRYVYRSYFRRKKKFFYVKKKRRKYTVERAKRRFKEFWPGKLAKNGKIFITLKRLNVFFTFTVGRRHKIRKKSSTGLLKFKGKRKHSAMARKQQARVFFKSLLTKNYRIYDIYLNRGGNSYRFLLHEFVGHKIIIRFIKRRKRKIHGMMRIKKAARK